MQSFERADKRTWNDETDGYRDNPYLQGQVKYFRLQVEIFDSVTIDLITEYQKTSENVDYF